MKTAVTKMVMSILKAIKLPKRGPTAMVRMSAMRRNKNLPLSRKPEILPTTSPPCCVTDPLIPWYISPRLRAANPLFPSPDIH
jgi:hypothetical protein